MAAAASESRPPSTFRFRRAGRSPALSAKGKKKLILMPAVVLLLVLAGGGAAS